MNTNSKILATTVLPALCLPYTLQAATPEKPNIVFVFCDQWRRQALGYMNQDPVQTPNLDRFASWAFSFDNAVSCRPVSGPNRACMLTGKYPINNGVFANSVPLAPDEKTLGEFCKAAGYTTGYIGKWHLNGFADEVLDPSRRHGFDFWVQSVGHSPFNQTYYIQDRQEPIRIKDKWSPTYETETAIDFISQHKDDEAPFCLVLSYNPPHTSGGYMFEDRYQPGVRNPDGSIKYGYGYGGPRQYEALYQNTDYEKHPIRGNVMPIGKTGDSSAGVVAGYFGAITAIDNDFGTLMKYLEQNNLLENTIVVFTADHGESMGSQGLMTKGTWFEEAAGVPCIIGWKGHTVNRRENSVFNSIDLLPTLLGMADIDASAGNLDGTDFSPMLAGEKMDAPQYAFLSFDFGGVAELKSPRYWRAVYTPRYTYVLCGFNAYRQFTKEGMVLYDKQKDPLQLHPIYRGMGYDPVIDQLHKVLADHLHRQGDPFLEEYWQNPEAGFPKLNRQTLPLDRIARDIEEGKLQPKKIKQYGRMLMQESKN